MFVLAEGAVEALAADAARADALADGAADEGDELPVLSPE